MVDRQQLTGSYIIATHGLIGRTSKTDNWRKVHGVGEHKVKGIRVAHLGRSEALFFAYCQQPSATSVFRPSGGNSGGKFIGFHNNGGECFVAG